MHYSLSQRIQRFLEFNNYKTYVFIFLVTSIASLIFVFITLFSNYVVKIKDLYISEDLFLFLLFNIITANIATGICDFVSQSAQGSGIPEIKSILTGVEYKGFFSVPTAIAKYTSIFFVRISGLGIGFEAAFIHIAAFLGDYCSKFGFFLELSKKEYRLSVVSAISVSIVIAFGSPIGGVIFVLELFSENFEMGNLYKSFLAAGISYFYYEYTFRYFNIKRFDDIYVAD